MTKVDQLQERLRVAPYTDNVTLIEIAREAISALREAQAEIERLNSLDRPAVAAGLPDAGVNAAEVALLDDAMFLLRQPGSHPSPSYVQRKLRVGYKTASTILENLERLGFVSPPNSVGVRRLNAGGLQMTTTDAPNATNSETDHAVESRLGEQAVPVGDASAVTFDELKDRVWNLCHTLLNGDVEAAEDLAEQLMEDLYP